MLKPKSSEVGMNKKWLVLVEDGAKCLIKSLEDSAILSQLYLSVHPFEESLESAFDETVNSVNSKRKDKALPSMWARIGSH